MATGSEVRSISKLGEIKIYLCWIYKLYLVIEVGLKVPGNVSLLSKNRNNI